MVCGGVCGPLCTGNVTLGERGTVLPVFKITLVIKTTTLTFVF